MEFMCNSEDNNTSMLQYRYFFDCLHSLVEKSELSPRAAEVIQMRLKGMSLDEIGEYYNVTREGIRQIEAKAMAILTKKAINDSKLSADLKQIIEKYISENSQIFNNETNSVPNKEDLLLNAIRLWCLYEGYEEVDNSKESFYFTDAVFMKENKSTGFIFGVYSLTYELIPWIEKAKDECDYLYVAIDDDKYKNDLIKIIPDYCGIFCYSNPSGLGYVTQILKDAKNIK